jgi:hypothetical protein
MAAIYLWLNAAIYSIFAVLCTVRATATSQSIGFTALNNGGMAEYVTVYGGMELGLGIIFAWLAYRPELHRTGIVLALALYAPLVIFRWISVARYWPVQGLTLGTGVLETTLLVLAVALWFAQRNAI